ncbi:hypothetical protein MA16_Dca009934 [Dendrobium catenatum]|uniref:Reverse transcriptase domain-containing protein n=1 Tax=Dendrobium catenatum TaxID=906689 RepID=A0A2I0WD82_9ASPA|nr:hypothetical protein MA16_Dca009934 [Dendrobium catenatum]
MRQGYPLSPLLFSVVMDAFSSMLHDPNNYHFKGILSNGHEYNHLLYADDVLVFGENSINNVKDLKLILNDFGNASALRINPLKSSIIFSARSSQHEDICNNLGIDDMAHCINYLGLPISPNKLNGSYFHSLINKISEMHDGWKVKFLSLAGRIQFLKFKG